MLERGEVIPAKETDGGLAAAAAREDGVSLSDALVAMRDGERG